MQIIGESKAKIKGEAKRQLQGALPADAAAVISRRNPGGGWRGCARGSGVPSPRACRSSSSRRSRRPIVVTLAAPHEDQALAAARQIDPGGSRIGDVMAVEWGGKPHFFLRGALLVSYVGRNDSVLAPLKEARGPPIARRSPLPNPRLHPTAAGAGERPRVSRNVRRGQVHEDRRQSPGARIDRATLIAYVITYQQGTSQ